LVSRGDRQEHDVAGLVTVNADGKPFVSIVMPALNEERYVAAAIATIVPRSPELRYEVLVVDGGSTDRTHAIVEDIAASDPRVRLLHNAKKIQAAALNLGAKLADPRADYLIRADCHVAYPKGFVERCIERLATGTADSVVVPMLTVGSTCLQTAIAAAQNSRLGNGGAAHRLAGRSGLVEHGHHAAFNRRTFLELGGYDETFAFNEDAEFDKRMVQSGKRIYLEGDALITYYPRADLKSLSRQYFNHGWGRASTLIKHRSLPRLRQMLPVAALLGCLLSLGLAALLDPAYAGLALAYVLACIAWGAAMAVARRQACLALSGVAAIVMHMSWATGFLSRLARPWRAQAGMAVSASRTR
jgi:succinoglycan biosynthesis protein ExoA